MNIVANEPSCWKCQRIDIRPRTEEAIVSGMLTAPRASAMLPICKGIAKLDFYFVFESLLSNDRVTCRCSRSRKQKKEAIDLSAQKRLIHEKSHLALDKLRNQRLLFATFLFPLQSKHKNHELGIQCSSPEQFSWNL
jgi:hypothetical protein